MRQKLSVFALIMINIAAVSSLRTLPFTALMGYSLVFYYLLALLTFLLPVALVSAELSTGWPDRGGIYAWVSCAFGESWGLLVVWLQWIYNLIWYPTILSFVVISLSYFINPFYHLPKSTLLIVILSIFWLTTLINTYGMKISSKISIISAILGSILPMVMIMGLAAIWLIQGHPIQIPLSWHSFLPHYEHINDLSPFLIILFGLTGIEISSTYADEVKQPKYSYPRAIFYSSLLIFITLSGSSLCIAMVIPHQELHIVAGVIQALTKIFNYYHLTWMKPVITVMILIGSIGSVSAWLTGPVRGLAVSARHHKLPQLFSYMNKHGAPTSMLWVQAFCFSALCLTFLGVDTISNAYWMLSLISAQLALLIYPIMFAAAIYLRYKSPDISRTYRIPGGLWGIWLVGGIGTLTCVLSFGLGLIAKHHMHHLFSHMVISITLFVVLIAIPFILTRIFHQAPPQSKKAF